MRQAGRYLPEYMQVRAQAGDFLKLCYTPEWASEVTLQPIRRFDMSAAILFSDILVIPHALGCDLKFVAGEGPQLSKTDSAETIAQLSLTRVEPHIQPVLETVRRVRAELPAEKALIGFAGSPWTVACYMIEGGGSRDFEKTRHFAYAQPALFSKLITLIEQATILYLSKQIDAGANALQLFDSWAGVLAPDAFSEWVIAPTARITRELKKRYPHIPLIGFPRLAGSRLAAYAKDANVEGISIDHTTLMPWAKVELENVNPKLVLQGNLDPLMLVYDLPKALEYSKNLLELFKEKPFIFNLGHGIIPATPVDHVMKLSELLHAGT
jgi:uroporphyrinogen decarboxylase